MIVVLGSINLDQVGQVPRLPRPGETVPGTAFTTSPGGKGANQALAARRAGAEVALVGAVGNDVFAAEALALLRRDGVDLSQVRTAPGATGIAMILVDTYGENVIAVISGANGTVSLDDAQRAVDRARPGDIILLQQEIPQAATQHALEAARARGLTSMLNTAPLLDTTAGVAGLASILVANESEFSLLAECTPASLDEAMAQWASRTGQTVVVTLGAKGAKAVTAGSRLHVPSPPITPVDTVGAGDTFCGNLAAALGAGQDIAEALATAASAASLACLAPGAQTAMPFTEGLSRRQS